MALPGRYRLPKALRLRRRSEFLAVQRRGRRWRGRFVVVICAPSLAAGPSRLGITVSRRVGCAVVRNRVKRLVREVYRLGQYDVPPALDFVVIARRAAREATFDDLQVELRRAFRAASPRGQGRAS